MAIDVVVVVVVVVIYFGHRLCMSNGNKNYDSENDTKRNV